MSIKPSLVLSILFTSTIAAAFYWGEPSQLADPDISLSLPDSVGDWTGSTPVYCQNMDCRKKYLQNGLHLQEICQSCGSSLGIMSPVETVGLPPDTQISRKEYRNQLGQVIAVSIVVTGTQRASIHKPQWCLPAQGYVINATHVMEIPMRDRKRLQATVLDVSTDTSGQRGTSHIFAYWFVGKGHETPYHTERLFWMAFDNIVHGVLQRWAYISVMTPNIGTQDNSLDMLSDFVAELYPAILHAQ